MPWPTTDGMRTLQGAECDLLLAAIESLTEQQAAALTAPIDPAVTGIQWFDQWDVAQRLWLLQQVGSALCGPQTIVSPAAIFDATADAIFHHIIDSLREQGDHRWQARIERADQQITGHNETPPPDPDDQPSWVNRVVRIADLILGVRLYQRAESFRDAEFQRTLRFLHERGLPPDYLSRIPPLCSTADAEQAIQCIRSLRR
ncbi:hypothetical protein NHH03_20380 [Stieleria sp. TO1_6]|uniref:hypothetical protein n=1 Tax=Stieleria tagensis TaxID=2956795 RepID=UPI00209AC49F|nr:hypothetical protein [Stieleria tagensis]MCO8124113.1 hypothetical protein [Stieleria tagensis]